MVNIFDVSLYILEDLGEMTAMKLQKLTFYVKAWGLVFNEDEIFLEDFQAWENGAISPVLYEKHKGMFKVTSKLFSKENELNDYEKETIDKVIKFYKEYTAQQLIDINRQEKPWIETRGLLDEREKLTKIIPNEKIAEYYSSLTSEK